MYLFHIHTHIHTHTHTITHAHAHAHIHKRAHTRVQVVLRKERWNEIELKLNKVQLNSNQIK